MELANNPSPSGEPAPRRRRLSKPGAALFFAALALLAGAGMLKTSYFDARGVLDEGHRGRFTVDRCEVTETSKSSSTYCYGAFRSEDGELVLEDHRLSDDQEEEGLRAGDSFTAHATDSDTGPATVVRSDAQGRNDLAMRGVGALGLTLLGVALAGLAAHWRMPSTTRRERLGPWLKFGAVLSALTWLIGSISGGGLWT